MMSMMAILVMCIASSARANGMAKSHYYTAYDEKQAGANRIPSRIYSKFAHCEQWRKARALPLRLPNTLKDCQPPSGNANMSTERLLQQETRRGEALWPSRPPLICAQGSTLRRACPRADINTMQDLATDVLFLSTATFIHQQSLLAPFSIMRRSLAFKPPHVQTGPV